LFAGGLETVFGELLNDLVSGAVVTGTTGVATLHVVVGKYLDVRPPTFAGLLPIRGSSKEGEGGSNGEAGSQKATHRIYTLYGVGAVAPQSPMSLAPPNRELQRV
jgi:hypothetical protein